ncbi:R-spondin-3 [Poecilia latipinna]|uniref:R-spondin 3 n=2 Tax=Poecilia TaxID=8080 RepID=A0A087YKT8_POEFO|nr:PREDICTED: R-spondin-3-like [Poecilia formosa]XP_007550330.1 PREDICTED: R-spondin-3-like [Poecilia formosa]XP_014877888.1 PREDICTED: R-spondin-3-like [Poecilia latipinna]
MQLQLISFVLIIWNCMDYSGCQPHSSSRHRQHKAMAGGSSGCQQSGCLTCSDYNGCLSCKPRLFMHLERIGMKQIGVCMTSCPPGFYGTRSPERNTCTKCRSECDSCFNKNFCTRCRAGFYLHLGKCLDSCPVGMVHSDAQRECVPRCSAECESCVNSDTCTRCRPGLYQLNGRCHHICPDDYEPNDKLMECTPQVHCEVGEWSEWSPCSRSGRTCGFRRGQETRTRQVQQYPSPFGNPCPDISEVKECLVKKKRCQGARRKTDRKERRNRNNRKDKESQEGRRERKRERERERDAGEREDSDNRNKTENRHRRGHDSQTISPEDGLVQ